MRRLAALAGVVVVATACSGHHTRTLGGYGVSVALPRGWYGLAAPGQLQVADFPLSRRVLSSAERAHVGRGHVHLIVWDGGPAVPYLARNYPRANPPLTLRRRDLTPAPLEGFPWRDRFALRTAELDGELIEVLADLGPKPLGARPLREVNRVLTTLKVRPPRTIRARGRALAADGIALRLLPGWTGRIELPPDSHAATLVLRAKRGYTRVELLELPTLGLSRQIRLPVAVSETNVVRGASTPVARRVFMANGRNFDLSVAFAAPTDLASANKLLRHLVVEPRPWTFSSCDFILRVPGTWTVGVRRHGGCYLTVTLRGQGLRVAITELRPSEHLPGLTLRRAGRRFHVDISPPSGEQKAAPYSILGTLRAKPRNSVGGV